MKVSFSSNKFFSLFLFIFFWWILFGVKQTFAQSVTTVSLIINHSFSASIDFADGEAINSGGVYYVNHRPLGIVVSSNTWSSYVLSGDLFVSLTWWSTTWAYQYDLFVDLSLWDGYKSISWYFYKDLSWYTEFYEAESLQFILDDTAPTFPVLITPEYLSEVAWTVNFSWNASIDTWVWLRYYSYAISRDSWFNNIVVANTTNITSFNYLVNSLADGTYFWVVTAEDMLWNTSTSTVRSFDVTVVDPWTWADIPPWSSGSPPIWWNRTYTMFDYCPEGDFSPSAYDDTCSDSDWFNENWEEEKRQYVVDVPENLQWEVSEELYLAFKFAQYYWLTDAGSWKDAKLYEPLLRKEAARIFGQFAVNVALLPTTANLTWCEWDDVDQESDDYQFYMWQACAVGVMWLETTWEPAESFEPNEYFTRAMFWTVLSRLLWWNKNNGEEIRYETHLMALQRSNIMQIIDYRWIPELRWYAFLMLQRTDDFWYVEESVAREPLGQ